MTGIEITVFRLIPACAGKTLDLANASIEGGLIPACAGKTFIRVFARGPLGAHPRVCGENRAFDVLSIGRMGSSPRVRGKPWRNDGAESGWGLIPACAGKTPWQSLPMMTDWAHPRVCGENSAKFLTPFGAFGSSPRVRGKPKASSRHLLDGRLIPACAGKTP